MWKRKILVIFVMSLLTCSAVPLPDVAKQSIEEISITSPKQDDILIGVVPIFGTSKITGFVRSEVAFAYLAASTETWFPISVTTRSVDADLLTVWDTTVITDGNYRLRLRVILEDDSILEFVVSHVSIRNYTPTETPFPSETPVLSAPTPTLLSATNTPVVLPTGLPENPLVLSPREIYMSVVYGFLVIFGLVVISGIYSRLQHK